jgi:uncharacterized protein (TIGR00369 family)
MWRKHGDTVVAIACLPATGRAAIFAAMIEQPATGKDTLRLDADALNAFLARAFPAGDPSQMPRVTHVAPGLAMLSAPTSERSLRPGGLISGPTLMSLADTAAYALILAHIGEVAMAVTTSLTIHFLRPCKPGDLVAEARMLKLGRRIATCEVTLWTEGRDRAAAKATVAYAIPDGAA